MNSLTASPCFLSAYQSKTGFAKVENTATLSRCRRYRYALWRVWDESKGCVMFVGLNPSTADEFSDDPTLAKCICYAKSWGYGAVCMANLFAFRAREPRDMLAAKDPIGYRNNFWLKKLSKNTDIVIAAWGNHGAFMNRAQRAIKLLPRLHCLQLNKTGEPAHPLYLAKGLKPVAYNLETKLGLC